MGDNIIMMTWFNNYKQLGLFIIMFVIIYVIEVITHRNNILYGLIPYVAEVTTTKLSKKKESKKVIKK
jgi:hypothetical protein